MTTNRIWTHIESMVSAHDRALRTRALDVVEYVLLVLAGLLLLSFTVTVFLDVVTRLAAAPILWLQEATLIAFVWGIFIGAAAAQRRREHFVVTSVKPDASPVRRTVSETFNGLVVLAVGLVVAVFGFLNFRQGFGNQLPVTGLPLATLTGALPVFGLLVSVFTIERLVLGWRLGFPAPPPDPTVEEIAELEGGHV